MARQPEQTEGARRNSRGSSRRTRGVVASAGLLFAVMSSGCAHFDAVMNQAKAESQVDILVLATDDVTTEEMLQRLHGVETWPAQQSGPEAWSRGYLNGARNGNVYTILVGQAGDQDGMATKNAIRKATRAWRPRYVLVLGTAPAVVNEDPLGAVGVVTLVCDFDLDRFEVLRDIGRCYRPDGGLFAAAISVADEWEAGTKTETRGAGCSPARVMKLAALSGNEDLDPLFVETVTNLSEDLHRGLIMEREGIFVAEAVEDLRHESKEPIGFLMIRGVSHIRVPGMPRQGDPEASDSEQRLLQKTCATRDTADFAVELIRQRWPVSSRAKR